MEEKRCRVHLEGRSYDILVGWEILKNAGDIIKNTVPGNAPFIITSRTVDRLYFKALKDSLSRHYKHIKKLTLPDGERAKDVRWWLKAIEELTIYDEKLERDCFIINFGGGVVGDLGGFVASTYRRGIPYVQIPTTLLAMADSGVGGKTAIDIKRGNIVIKNKVGTIYQPSIVICDVSTLKTLNRRELVNGFAEVIKHAIVFSRNFYNYIRKHLKEILNLEREFILKTTFWSYRIKANVVSKDERESKGYRTLLNFGHTVGHAVEGASEWRLKHGEAVAIGIACACDISVRLGLMKKNVAQEIEEMLKTVGLPTRISGIKKESVIKLLLHDKKFKRGKTRLVLLKEIGKPLIVEGVDIKLIEEVVAERLS